LRTNEAKPGLGYCCPAVRTHYPHASATVTLCPATTQPHIVLLHFFRSLSADGKEKRIILKDIICWLGKTKAGKGLQENRAGSMASRAEGFFLLDFFVSFCIKTKRKPQRQRLKQQVMN